MSLTFDHSMKGTIAVSCTDAIVSDQYEGYHSRTREYSAAQNDVFFIGVEGADTDKGTDVDRVDEVVSALQVGSNQAGESAAQSQSDQKSAWHFKFTFCHKYRLSLPNSYLGTKD